MAYISVTLFIFMTVATAATSSAATTTPPLTTTAAATKLCNGFADIDFCRHFGKQCSIETVRKTCPALCEECPEVATTPICDVRQQRDLVVVYLNTPRTNPIAPSTIAVLNDFVQQIPLSSSVIGGDNAGADQGIRLGMVTNVFDQTIGGTIGFAIQSGATTVDVQETMSQLRDVPVGLADLRTNVGDVLKSAVSMFEPTSNFATVNCLGGACSCVGNRLYKYQVLHKEERCECGENCNTCNLNADKNPGSCIQCDNYRVLDATSGVCHVDTVCPTILGESKLGRRCAGALGAAKLLQAKFQCRNNFLDAPRPPQRCRCSLHCRTCYHDGVSKIGKCVKCKNPNVLDIKEGVCLDEVQCNTISRSTTFGRQCDDAPTTKCRNNNMQAPAVGACECAVDCFHCVHNGTTPGKCLKCTNAKVLDLALGDCYDSTMCTDVAGAGNNGLYCVGDRLDHPTTTQPLALTSKTATATTTTSVLLVTPTATNQRRVRAIDDTFCKANQLKLPLVGACACGDYCLKCYHNGTTAGACTRCKNRKALDWDTGTCVDSNLCSDVRGVGRIGRVCDGIVSHPLCVGGAFLFGENIGQPCRCDVDNEDCYACDFVSATASLCVQCQNGKYLREGECITKALCLVEGLEPQGTGLRSRRCVSKTMLFARQHPLVVLFSDGPLSHALPQLEAARNLLTDVEGIAVHAVAIGSALNMTAFQRIGWRGVATAITPTVLESNTQLAGFIRAHLCSDRASYSPLPTPTMAPSTAPTIAPVSSVPTVSPSSPPSSHPTVSTPTISPSQPPSTSAPSGFPTSLPSVAPSMCVDLNFCRLYNVLECADVDVGPTLVDFCPRLCGVCPTPQPTTSPTQPPSSPPTPTPTSHPTPCGVDDGTTTCTEALCCAGDVGYQVTIKLQCAATCCDVNCTTDAPTSAPSPEPTAPPSNTPSANPTLPPTNTPTTRTPTAHPTVTPTALPTTVPTFVPSVSPSMSPTTASPTATPSNAPTPSPTAMPTLFPTQSLPTQAPTHVPTPQPTSQPSVSPTPIPTLFPTQAPSRQPTTTPSFSPTPTAPSVSPTFIPSNTPTRSPTTSTPTQVPTTHPTTNTPTSSPSPLPTTSPAPCPVDSDAIAVCDLGQCCERVGFTSFYFRDLCRTTCCNSVCPNITESPVTSSPTHPPTSLPTTLSPTTNPITPSPTHAPTSTYPSASPTHPPVPQPTQAPSPSPTCAVSDALGAAHCASVVASLTCCSRAPGVLQGRVTLAYYCARSCCYHTCSPTATPTLAPSSTPTSTPTTSPTVTPTTPPTSVPSVTPTATPSVSAPTSAPSVTPTSLPTHVPTMSSPTLAPTQLPTHVPTRAPSYLPSHSPSTQPSAIPTTTPTTSPTSSPSCSDVADPDVECLDNPQEFCCVRDVFTRAINRASCPNACCFVTCPTVFSPTSLPTHVPSSVPSTPPSATPTMTPAKTPTASPSCSDVADPQPECLDNPQEFCCVRDVFTQAVNRASCPNACCFVTCPTVFSPTSLPTPAPSLLPTFSPVASTSVSPVTPPPTAEPTFSPESPSVSPSTPPPTPFPTLSPVASTSSSPTIPPSTVPVTVPTVAPTAAPTCTADPPYCANTFVYDNCTSLGLTPFCPHLCRVC